METKSRAVEKIAEGGEGDFTAVEADGYELLALLKQRPQRPQPHRPTPPRRNRHALAMFMMITEEEALTLRELPAVKLLYGVWLVKLT